MIRLFLLLVMPGISSATEAVVRRAASLYAEANTKSPVLDRLPPGAKVSLASPNQINGFYHVRHSGQEGYIYRTLVKVEKADPSAFTGNIHLKYGIPGTKDLILLYKDHYVVGYDPSMKTPSWTSHRLSKDDLKTGRDRAGKWKPEMGVPADARAQDKDYRNSGHARGHLVPSADMVRSAQAMQDTFIFSNCAPQIQNGFNGGIWAQLEGAIREAAKKHGEVWVYTGIIFDPDENGTVKYIGNEVGIPTRWYKIVYHPDDAKVNVFLMKNQRHDAKYNDPSYRVSVDEIEEITGYDFLRELPDELESKIESMKGDPL